MSREIILDALNGIRDEFITEAGAKLGLLAGGAAAVGAAGAAAGAPELVSISATEATAKTGFAAWLAKGGWVALTAGLLVAAGVAVGAFFLGSSGDTPAESGEVTAESTEQGILGETDRETEDGSQDETRDETRDETTGEDESNTETETETEAHVHSFGAWQFTVTPTCTERGVRARTCSICSAVEEEDMPAGLHTYENSSCTSCGEKLTGMEFTSYGDGTCGLTDAGRIRGDMVIPNYSPEGDLVIAIEKNVFSSGGFNSLVWPERLISIGESAFGECTVLGDGFALPEGLISIGENAFAYCKRITTIRIPASVTEIGQGAFRDITALTEITFGEGSQLQAIPPYFAANTAVSAITLPDTVTSIGTMAFTHTALQEFHLPDGVTGVEASAFAGCTQLTAVYNTAQLTQIGQEAFAGCSALSAFPLSDNLTYVGSHAFRGCSSLAYTEYDGGYYLAIGENPYAILAYGSMDVTSASLHADARLAIGGAFEGNTALTAFTFTDGTVEIPDRFFYGCTSLTSVNMPASLTRVGDEAFYKCYVLPSLTLPDGVLTVGASAFSGCRTFTEMVLPDSITEIGAQAFAGCKSLTSIQLPASLTAIPYGLLENCYSLIGTLVIPEGITSIGPLPFDGCKELMTVVIPRSVVRFEEQVFYKNVYSVEYAGTMAEWEAIEKEDNWRSGNSTLYTVICTDGRINYD